MDSDFIIIGAGLTGLSAANYLKSTGAKVMVLEKESSVGGRIKTSVVNGFTLDHGFQVILSSYDELNKLIDIKELKARSFLSGARIRLNNKFIDIYNPFKHPFLNSNIFNESILTFFDLYPFLKLFSGFYKKHPRKQNTTALIYLKSVGFSDAIINEIFIPFFSGVFLDRELNLDAGILKFLFARFAFGSALLPQMGAVMLPELLAKKIDDSVFLNHSIKSFGKNTVELENGTNLKARKIIVTYGNCNNWNETITIYYSAKVAPYSEPILTISSEVGPINNLQVLTNVQPRYALNGQALISISVLPPYCGLNDEELCIKVKEQLDKWYGNQVNSWEFLKLFRVPMALPSHPKIGEGFYVAPNGVIHAGDNFTYGSQNGALFSGRMAANFAKKNVVHSNT